MNGHECELRITGPLPRLNYNSQSSARVTHTHYNLLPSTILLGGHSDSITSYKC